MGREESWRIWKPRCLFSMFFLLSFYCSLPVATSQSCSASTGAGAESSEKECSNPDVSSKSSMCKLVVAPSTIPNAGLGIFTTVPLAENELIGYGDLVVPIPRIPSNLPDPLEDYSWNGRIYSGELNGYSPGLQSLMNSHLALLNVHQVRPATNVFPDESSSTPYHYLQNIAEHDIPAGGELFTFYGDHWFQGRERFQDLPLPDDFIVAGEIAKGFHNLTTGISNYSYKEELWTLIKSFPYHSKVMEILPPLADVSLVAEKGVRHLYQPNATRPLSELSSEQSRCLDLIRPGPSKVHNLGAFATRKIPKGSVVTGSPLLHTTKERWNIHGQVWDAFTKSYKTSTTGKVDLALLANYCFSGIDSSLLLCPYSVGVGYINHSRKPNIKVQWAPSGQISHNVTWMSLTPKDLAKTNKVGLALDYVALRDIEEDEELLLDYGDAWDEAYADFAVDQPKPKASPDFWNSQKVLLTEAEQAAQPYPENLEFGCHPDVMTNVLKFEQTDLWEKNSNSQVLDCQILERQPQNQHGYITYAIRVFYENTWRGRAGIPREYIRFFEREGFKNRPFRFPMQLPNEMVPPSWRDEKR